MNKRIAIPVLVAFAAGCAETVSYEPPAPTADAGISAPEASVPERCPANVGALRVARAEDQGPTAPFRPELPLTAEEEAFNTARAPAEQLVAWESSEVRLPGGASWVFYGRYLVRPGYLNFQGLGASVARRNAPGARPTREPGALLFPTEPQFTSAAVLHEGFVHAYACRIDGFLDAACRLGRVPEARVADRGAWTFWDGGAWSEDILRARDVNRGMHGFSLTWNRHLGRWLALSGQILGDTASFRTAERLEGPWSAPVRAFTGLPAGDGHSDYNFALVPDASDPEGCTVAVRYDHPTSPTSAETRLVRVTLE
ncbi:MAG: DUF4185 domain-containing protein [Deltaproteobacteria bacterium]|nr:DUF4185 domain-containing protein [Deltaproteobacteria bacterium]